MNLEQFKNAVNDTFQQIGLDIKALNAWKNNLINDAQTALTSVWSSKKVSDELADKVDKVAGKGLSDENYTQAEKTKLAGLESSKFLGSYTSLSALQTAHPTASEGNYADVDSAGEDAIRYIWDETDTQWVPGGEGTALTAAQVKTMYESNPDTNAFTDNEQSKLAGIETGAEKNTLTGVKGSAEGSYRTGNVSIALADLDAGTDDPLTTYTNARDN